MISSLFFFVALSLFLFITVVWLLSKPLSAQRSLQRADKPEIESLFALHCRHFPQMRQALSQADTEFLAHRLPAGELKLWRGERRRVLRSFLTGLGEDYARLDYMARKVAALSPAIERKRELERLWLGLEFRVLYRIVLLRLVTEGFAPRVQLEQLTQLLATLSSRLEAAMESVNAGSLPPPIKTTFSP